MSDKHQPAQQNKPKAQAQKPKQQAKPKPLLPVEVAPVEQAWEAPIPAPTILRQALSNPAQVTPDVLRSLQRTMGNEFTGQFARTNVPEALHRVQALAHSRTAQRDKPDDAAATDDPLADFSTHPLAASLGLVPPVATTVQRAADPLAGQDVQGNVEGEIEKNGVVGNPSPMTPVGTWKGSWARTSAACASTPTATPTPSANPSTPKRSPPAPIFSSARARTARTARPGKNYWPMS